MNARLQGIPIVEWMTAGAAERVRTVSAELDEVASVSGESALVTAYVDNAQNSRLVRVDLIAQLRNIKQSLAGALIPAGYNGPAMSATGIAADVFSLSVSAPAIAGTRGIDVRGALIAAPCCAGAPSIRVPDALRCVPVVGDDLALLDQPLAPFEQGSGRPRVYAGDPGGPYAFESFERVTWATFEAAAGGGTYDVTLADGTTSTVSVIGSQALNLPAGVCVASIGNFVNMETATIWTVR